MRDQTDGEDDQGNNGDAGYHHHNLQRFAGATQVNADEDNIKCGVNGRTIEAEYLVHISADEYRDSRRRDRIFQQDGGAGEEASPGPHGAPGETITPAGGGKRRR